MIGHDTHGRRQVKASYVAPDRNPETFILIPYGGGQAFCLLSEKQVIAVGYFRFDINGFGRLTESKYSIRRNPAA